MKKNVNHIINGLIILFSFVSVVFSSCFLNYKSDENTVLNISNILGQENGYDNYNRVILGSNEQIGYDSFVSFERNYLKKMYRKSTIFSISQTILDFGETIDVAITEYDVKEDSKQYLIQDIKFYGNYNLTTNDENVIIISSNLAKKISNTHGFGNDYSQIINNIQLEVLGEELSIGAIYDSNNGYNCNNKLYGLFGETIMVNSEYLLKKIDNFNELKRMFYFTLCSNYRINLNAINACRSIFKKIVYPNLPINENFYDGMSLQQYISNYKNGNNTPLIAFGIIFLLTTLVSFAFLCYRFLYILHCKNDFIIAIVSIILISLLVLLFFSRVIASSFTIFNQTILWINKVSIVFALTMLFVFIVFSYISYYFNKARKQETITQKEDYIEINI